MRNKLVLNTVAAALLLSLLGPAGVALAQTMSPQVEVGRDFEDEDDKPWEEIVPLLPPAPAAADLLPLEGGPTSTHNFAIDARSLKVGADGVVRFTLVISSASGAKNITHEGIRCKSFEKKLYALGRNDGSWGRPRVSQWEPIKRTAINRLQAGLALDYFCEGRTVAGNDQAILERIRWQRRLPGGRGGM